MKFFALVFAATAYPVASSRLYVTERRASNVSANHTSIATAPQVVDASAHNLSAKSSVAATTSSADTSKPEAVGVHTKEFWTETVQHDKEAGNGYLPGSPLYKRQQDLKEKKASAKDDSGWEDAVDVAHEGGTAGHVKRGVAVFLFQIIIILIIAALYEPYRYRECHESPKTHDREFGFGLFTFDNCSVSIFLCSCCCLPIRWADTVSKKEHPFFLNFWVALLIMAGLTALDFLGYGLPGLLALLVAVFYRQKLRTKYGLEGGAMSLVWDILAWCCCAPCAAAQEAKQVEFVECNGERPKAMQGLSNARMTGSVHHNG